MSLHGGFSFSAMLRMIGSASRLLINSKAFSLSSRTAIKASALTKENLPEPASHGCPICSRGITFSYQDVLFLSQFMDTQGRMLNRRVTGVCKRQQKVLEKKVNVARRLGILPNFTKIKQEINF